MIANRLMEAALEGGDLSIAEALPIDMVNRLEDKREQLAFDPLGRRQWFADNLGPYRRLLRVAVLKNNAPLARLQQGPMEGPLPEARQRPFLNRVGVPALESVDFLYGQDLDVVLLQHLHGASDGRIVNAEFEQILTRIRMLSPAPT